MTNFLKRTSLATALIFAFGTAAAFPITVSGANDPANNTAEIDAPTQTPTQLLITVDNTSNFNAVITAIAFSLFDGLANSLVSVTGTLDNNEWSFSADADSGNGTFNLNLESYAITGNNVNGGNPQAGISTGSIGNFLFGGTFGSNLGLEDVFVRWQQTGSDGEGSDFGSGCTNGPCTTTKVSEPASLTLFGLGLVFAGFAARRRKMQV